MASAKRALSTALGNLIGAHIIPKGHVTWNEEKFAADLFAALEPDCIFDIGANVGQFGTWLRKMGYRGTILSFEPSPTIVEKLNRVAQSDENWHVFPYAVGDINGTLPFNIMEHDVLSSFLSPSTDADAPFKKVNVVSETIDVPVKTLDTIYGELAARYVFKRPILKMDTQGFDLKVTAGAGAAINNFLAILSEVAVRRLYKDNPMLWESIEFFHNLGFDLLRLFPVHPRKILNPLEFNCYLLRHDLAA